MSADDIELIQRADTLFIASAARTESALTSGADVSHRGGLPGFVHVDGDAMLTVSDYRGNFFFNTLGNLMLDPRAGLLLIDFEGGGLLQLAVRAEIVWSGREVERFAGAQRLLRLHVSEVVQSNGAHCFTWTAPEFAPQLTRQGSG